MRKHLATLALIASAAGLVAAPLDARPRPTGEERLAKMLEGRVAGEPRDCIFTSGSRGLTMIEGTALVYKDGRRIWVNRTAHPEDLDESDIMVIKRYGSANLCRQEQITLVDRNSGMFSGAVFLTDFVPYEKAN